MFLKEGCGAPGGGPTSG